MSFSDLFGSGEHLRNLGHFASIVNLATVDGALNPEEEAQLRRFAQKLDIGEEEYLSVLANPNAFPINPHNEVQDRLQRLHDLLKIVFSDHQIDQEEMHLLKKYAIGLGFTSKASEEIIKRSVEIFSGQISFEDYVYLLRREE